MTPLFASQRCSPRRRAAAALAAIASLVALLLLGAALVWLDSSFGAGQAQPPLFVYCAAGLRAAVEPAVKQFEQESGVSVRMQYGPSGGLESQIKLSKKGSLFIPAAIDPFLARGRQAGWVREILTLAELRLVLAVHPDCGDSPASMADLIRGETPYGLANPTAAAGGAAESALIRAGIWETAERRARVFLPTVTELAEAVRQADEVQAAPLWDATARQYGLRIVQVPEFAGPSTQVGVGVLKTAPDPAAALRLARYLAAPEKGQVFFQRQLYDK